ncbi:hypothetical protein [Nocardia carnea]|uniref:hypothetical protein n=1 Tax=Nocardia carnea TaxID=37328 RepID=UPI002453C8BE|nr:hypothetical protein [Nocardia carnea]
MHINNSVAVIESCAAEGEGAVSVWEVTDDRFESAYLEPTWEAVADIAEDMSDRFDSLTVQRLDADEICAWEVTVRRMSGGRMVYRIPRDAADLSVRIFAGDRQLRVDADIALELVLGSLALHQNSDDITFHRDGRTVAVSFPGADEKRFRYELGPADTDS